MGVWDRGQTLLLSLEPLLAPPSEERQVSAGARTGQLPSRVSSNGLVVAVFTRWTRRHWFCKDRTATVKAQGCWDTADVWDSGNTRRGIDSPSICTKNTGKSMHARVKSTSSWQSSSLPMLASVGGAEGWMAWLAGRVVKAKRCKVATWGRGMALLPEAQCSSLCPGRAAPFLHTSRISQWKKLRPWSHNVSGYRFVPVQPWAFVLGWCLPTYVDLQQRWRTGRCKDRLGVRVWAVPCIPSRAHPYLQQLIEISRFPLDLHHHRQAEAPEKFTFPEELCTSVQSTPTLFSGLFL